MPKVGITIEVREDGSVEVKKLGGEFTKTGDKAENSAKKTTSAWDKVKAKSSGWASSVKGLATSWIGLTAVIAGTTKLIKDSIDAFLVQEKAENDLAAAMKINATYTKAAHKELMEFAAARQEVTTYGDEMTIQNMALLQSFGMNTEEIKKATIAAQDFASGLNIDLRTAALLVGKAFAGDTATLSRYGIKIEEGLNKSQKFAAVMKQLGKHFGGRAQADLDTYAGKIKNLGLAWGDMLEKATKWSLDVYLWASGMDGGVKLVGASEIAEKKLAKAQKELKEETNALIEEEKKRRENIKELQKATIDYANQIDKLGDRYLEIASTRFSESLKAEKNGIQALQDSMYRYQAVIAYTYQTRREMHLAVITEIANQKDKEKELHNEQVAMAKSQLSQNDELLKSYQSYYDALKKLQTNHVKEYKKTLKDLADFEQDTLKTSNKINQLIQDEKTKIFGDNRSEQEKYYDQMTKLDRQYTQALALGGKEKMSALEQFIETVSKLAEEQESIRTGFPPEGIGMLSDTALERMQKAQGAWEKAKTTITETMRESALESQLAAQKIEIALNQAAQEIDFFTQDVLALQRELDNLQANILVSLDDQASPGIDAIRQNLETLHDKTITITTRHVEAYGGSGQSGSLDGYATGLDLVPRDMDVRVHRGERIQRAAENPYNPAATQVSTDNRKTENHFHFSGPPPVDQGEMERLISKALRKAQIKVF